MSINLESKKALLSVISDTIENNRYLIENYGYKTGYRIDWRMHKVYWGDFINIDKWLKLITGYRISETSPSRMQGTDKEIYEAYSKAIKPYIDHVSHIFGLSVETIDHFYTTGSMGSKKINYFSKKLYPVWCLAEAERLRLEKEIGYRADWINEYTFSKSVISILKSEISLSHLRGR